MVPFVPGNLAERVDLVDLDGSGVPGVVMVGRRGARAAGWYLSLRALGGYPLERVDGGLGDRLDIAYRSSVDEAARDRQAGRPWVTFLPFAVPVVSAVTRRRWRGDIDHVTRYRYHDGSWDTSLQRFVGFGRVDTIESSDESAAGVWTTSTFHVGRTPERVGRGTRRGTSGSPRSRFAGG